MFKQFFVFDRNRFVRWNQRIKSIRNSLSNVKPRIFFDLRPLLEQMTDQSRHPLDDLIPKSSWKWRVSTGQFSSLTNWFLPNLGGRECRLTSKRKGVRRSTVGSVRHWTKSSRAGEANYWRSGRGNLSSSNRVDWKWTKWVNRIVMNVA